MRKYHTDHTEKNFRMTFSSTKIKLLGFYGGDLKDTNERQGVFWPYKKERPIRSGLCVAWKNAFRLENATEKLFLSNSLG